MSIKSVISYSKDFLETSQYTTKIEVFFKGFYLFFLLKVVLIAPLYKYWTTGHDSVEKILVVKILVIFILLLGLSIRRNYFLSFLIFVCYFIFHRFTHEVINGSDLVMSFFMFLGVFCNQRPSLSSKSWAKLIQIGLINTSILLGQLQIALMYFHSGWDKINNVAWRNGEAFYNIINIDFYALPWVNAIFGDVSSGYLVAISWLVIVFELIFSLLVWLPSTRFYVLFLGLIFHGFIGFGLSLPDFALIMIWCYLLFVPDRKFLKVLAKVRFASR